MGKVIKAKIDGIDVELELSNFGDDADGAESSSPQIKVIKVGNDNLSEDDKKKIEDKVNSHSAELIADIISALEEVTVNGKPWWQSRILWVNIIAIISSIAAFFGFHFSLLTPDICMTIVPIILSVLNIYLRLRSKHPIQPIIVPAAIEKLR